MRTQTRKIYTFNELRKKAREHAIDVERARRENSPDVPWMYEIIDSLKAVFKAANLILKDWEIGGESSRSYVKVEFPQEEAGDLTGPRAMAWLENNLLGKLRVKTWAEAGGERRLYRHNSYPGGPRVGSMGIKDAMRYHYRVGEVPDCPLTGVAFDDTYLEVLKKELNGNKGITVKEAFEGLAQEASKMIQAEIDWELSDKGITEFLAGMGHEFLYNGDRR